MQHYSYSDLNVNQKINLKGNAELKTACFYGIQRGRNYGLMQSDMIRWDMNTHPYLFSEIRAYFYPRERGFSPAKYKTIAA